MRVLEQERLIAKIAASMLLLLLTSLCLSCAAVKPRSGGLLGEHATVLDIQHSRSRKPSDCLAVCAGMVLKYYGVPTTIPDSALPLELISLSHRLNSDTTVDEQGHLLFATVLELSPGELAAQITKRRPLILAFKPSVRKEYHSIVVSGYNTESGRFYIHDPARSKPRWKSLSRIPTFGDSGKYLVLLIGLREK
jgi:ABC-type bacteriocin/lantibiotic exporter with double-glycine peptidase domain